MATHKHKVRARASKKRHFRRVNIYTSKTGNRSAEKFADQMEIEHQRKKGIK